MLNQPHRRYNPLTDEWVLVSPQRTSRPWLGQVEKEPSEILPQYDPHCSLCPGNTRASGIQNPDYTTTFVFENDFPALLPATPVEPQTQSDHPLFKSETESGICKVVCFSPRHDLTLPDLSRGEVETILITWKDESEALGHMEEITYVQVFENKGAMMGCSNPHPHSQIWATAHIPNEPAKEFRSQANYLREHGSQLLVDYVKQERISGERIVTANDRFTALVPFWAVWPYEVLISANRPIKSLTNCDSQDIESLAEMMREITRRYDKVFNVSFPYSMGFHQAPFDGRGHPEWILHAHFYPPLLRSATVRKFMVGYEMLAMPQRDLTPETAAQHLREVQI